MSETTTLPVESVVAISQQDRVSELETKIFNELIHTQTVTDQADFIRRRYTIGSTGLEVEFRGVEELPETTEVDDNRTHVVVASDIKPQLTSQDEFGYWAQNLTSSQHDHGLILSRPTPNSIEQDSEKIWNIAARQNSEAVILHSPATAEGVIDVALQLSRNGIGDSSVQPKLLAMRDSFKKRKFGENEEALLDEIFALSTALTREEMDKPKEDGLIVAALALAGVPEAIEMAEIKQKRLRIYDSATFTQRVLGYKPDTSKPVTQPGEEVTSDAMETVRQAHLVAVHTTSTKPLLGRIILPAAEFNIGKNGRFPRDSVHFSLNHAVESNLGGDFTGQPYTIVAPLEGLLNNNGAPLAMADVDTYFATGPGEGVVLSADTIIVEVAAGKGAGPLVINEGSPVFYPDSLNTAQDVVNFASVMNKWTKEADKEEMSKLPDYTKYWYDKEREGKTEQEIALMYLSDKIYEDGMLRVTSLRHGIGAKLDSVAGAGEFKELVKEHYVQYSKNTSARLDPKLARAFVDALPELMADSIMRKVVVEKFRTLLTNNAIRIFGGKVVIGGAHYTMDSDFQMQSIVAARAIGVTTALHSNTDEARFEEKYWRAITKAATIKEVHTGNNSDRNMFYTFDWTKYSTGDMWSTLLYCPKGMRRRAIEMGFLTFAKNPEKVVDDGLY